MTQPYVDLAKVAGEKHGVPWGLVWGCASIESSLRPDAVRYEKHLNDESRGLMQMLTATARDMGFDPDDLWDPAFSMDAGAKYLRWLYDRYWEIPCRAERWRFAVGAYNAGRGNVNRALTLARQATGCGLSPKTAKPGLWQEWWFTAPRFLPKVTRDSSTITIRHVEKVWAKWAFIEMDNA